MRPLLLIVPLVLPLACAPEARWPQETSSQIASPAQSPVPEAIATAVQWWMTREPTASGGGPVPVALSLSLEPATDRVHALLGDCVMGSPDDPAAIVVRAVRMHHASAQIDLDAPRRLRGRQLVTVDMQKFLLTPWEVTGANWWRFNDRQLQRITAEAAAAASARQDDADATTADATDTDEP